MANFVANKALILKNPANDGSSITPIFKYFFSLFPIIEQLETMITDENAMFDVLGDFFYHVNTKVRVAALEVSHFT